MKPAVIIAGIVAAALSSPASAGTQEEAVKGLVKAVKRGEDLGAVYPGAVIEREIESLRRVSKCSATNLMKQEQGRYTLSGIAAPRERSAWR